MIILGFILAVVLSELQARADFIGKGLDQDLRIKIQRYVGTKPGNRGKSFIRARLQRQDEEARFFCTRSFKLYSRHRDLILNCSKHVGTIGHEDEEALSFEIRSLRTRTRSGFSVTNISYAGEGSFFENELYTLLGAGWRQRVRQIKIIPLILTARRTLGVFADLEALLEASTGILGRKVLIDGGGLALRLPVKSIHADVSTSHQATVFAILDTSELDAKIRVNKVSGPAVIDLSDWQDKDLLSGLNIN